MKRPRLDSDPARLATIQTAILATLEMAVCMRSWLRKIVHSQSPVLLTDEEKVKLLEHVRLYRDIYGRR